MYLFIHFKLICQFFLSPCRLQWSLPMPLYEYIYLTDNGHVIVVFRMRMHINYDLALIEYFVELPCDESCYTVCTVASRRDIIFCDIVLL